MSIFSKDSTGSRLGKVLARFRAGDSFSLEIIPGYIFTVNNKFNATLKKKKEKECKQDETCQERKNKHDNKEND
ncbi:hypothetical protein ACIQZM_14100 [Peribacillus sp. NPDC097206]|uniref:hypothetical protein n=1 Tax=unclassified Peribacillus TaxID=2675266 RepID=UPI0038304AB2